MSLESMIWHRSKSGWKKWMITYGSFLQGVSSGLDIDVCDGSSSSQQASILKRLADGVWTVEGLPTGIMREGEQQPPSSLGKSMG